MADSWERLAHEMAASLMHDVWCPDHWADFPQPDCGQCGKRALFDRYAAKCRTSGRVVNQPGHLGNVDLFTVDEVMASGRQRRLVSKGEVQS